MKKKLNYQLLNIMVICAIMYLVYHTFGIWTFLLRKLFSVLFPLLIAFAIAYALYPFVKKLMKRKIPKWLAIFLVIAFVVGFISIIISLIIPIMVDQFNALFVWIADLAVKLSKEYNVNLSYIQEYVGDFKTILNNLGSSLGSMSATVITKAIGFITNGMIISIISIYFLIYMDQIRNLIKRFLTKKKERTYLYVKTLDHQVSQYFIGLQKYILIQFIEYTTVFFLIGHPYYLLLGVLCSVTTIIPYFGGIFANIIAAITSFFISKSLFIWTLVIAFICPNIDGYVISPRIYGKTNNVPALLTILAAFAGGKIGGIIGIVVALPITIILLTTYRFYEKDIHQKYSEVTKKEKVL